MTTETTHLGGWAGRGAIVTGAGSGIGRATAILLAELGCTVLGTDIDEAGLAETRTLAGGLIHTHTHDVTSESAWEEVMERAARDLGRPGILVNCAGIAHVALVGDTALADWRRVLAINLDGVFLGTRAGVRAMRGTGGSIINVASASGIKPAPASSAYCASKAAVIMLTKSVALECLNDRSGIRVNAVAPGGVKTPMWANTPGAAGVVGSDEWSEPADAPLGKRFAEPIEVARAIAFLASDAASYVTGSVLSVDAGYTAT